VKREDDFREEIEFHVEMRAELNRQAGAASEEARESARRQFGNATLIQEDMRRMHINTFLESLLQDLRYAARGFARQPLFTLTTVFAAALGIGSATAVFSVVDRILFRSLPYAQDDRLVSLGMIAPLDTNEFLFADAYFDWRKHQTPFTSITSFTAGVADGGQFSFYVWDLAGSREGFHHARRCTQWSARGSHELWFVAEPVRARSEYPGQDRADRRPASDYRRRLAGDL
jgi:hypothetical protein